MGEQVTEQGALVQLERVSIRRGWSRAVFTVVVVQVVTIGAEHMPVLTGVPSVGHCWLACPSVISTSHTLWFLPRVSSTSSPPVGTYFGTLV